VSQLGQGGGQSIQVIASPTPKGSVPPKRSRLREYDRSPKELSPEIGFVFKFRKRSQPYSWKVPNPPGGLGFSLQFGRQKVTARTLIVPSNGPGMNVGIDSL
jgi:hypothetical protein